MIDKFDVSDPDTTTFVASGEVPGYLLNQFSLSEYDGVPARREHEPPDLVGRARSAVAPPQSQSYVTVLQPKGGVLAPVGQVSGLGQGEQIYSVRFVGDTGLRRHVPPGRPALHDRPERRRRRRRWSGSSSSRATRPTCTRSATGSCSASGATSRPTRTSRRARSSSCSTSPTRRRRSCSRRRRSAPAPRRRRPTTTTRSCTGRRPASPCCRCRPTGRGVVTPGGPRHGPPAVQRRGRVPRLAIGRDRRSSTQIVQDAGQRRDAVDRARDRDRPDASTRSRTRGSWPRASRPLARQAFVSFPSA